MTRTPVKGRHERRRGEREFRITPMQEEQRSVKGRGDQLAPGSPKEEQERLTGIKEPSQSDSDSSSSSKK